MSKIEPSKVYDFVLEKLQDMKDSADSISADSVGASSDDDSLEAQSRAKQLQEVRKQISEFEANATKSALDYKNVAEFNTFTIAFYGETNAGKSTIIESLRIYFGESTKQDSRAKFDKSYEAFKYYSEAFLGKIFAFFAPYLKSNALKKMIDCSDGVIIGDGRADFTQKSQTYHFDNNGVKFDILDVPGIEGKENAVIDEILKATKKAHCVFYITRNPQPPQKGDSPSGESKGTQPKGTIEKIKEHLGAQTEVFSIFNKSVTNLMQLSDSIIQTSDESGLNDLDKIMTQTLDSNEQKHYAGRKTLSAQVAFYALGDKMISVDLPQNAKDEATKAKDLAQKREKFIAKYSKDELLEKSLFLDFAKFISDDLAQNVGAKIKKSNFNKAHRILLGMNETLEFVHKTYSDLYDKCAKEVEDSCHKIERILDSAKSNFEVASDSVIRAFRGSVQNIMYDYIDDNVSDDSFKNKFKAVLESQQQSLNDKFKEAFEKEQKQFGKDIEVEIENLQRRIGNIAKDFQNLTLNNDFDSNLSINIDNGLNTAGLIGAGVGVIGLAITMTAANLWNPAGWAAAGALAIAAVVMSAVGIVVGAVKSVWKFFSDDYKMSEQRKAVDTNLRNICGNMQTKVNESIKNNIEQNLQPYIEDIQDNLSLSIEPIQEASEFFGELRENEVLPLAEQIKIEGGL
ncbi:hypothetical protein [Helicobacter sp. 23-1046]